MGAAPLTLLYRNLQDEIVATRRMKRSSCEWGMIITDIRGGACARSSLGTVIILALVRVFHEPLSSDDE